MKHCVFLSLSESRSCQPPHPLCTRGASFTCYQGSDRYGLERGTFLTAAAPRLRQWLQPLCFFHLHECNSGWLSSSAQCTSSGKVSSLSHRQSGQSAWHRGGRAEHGRFNAEKCLTTRQTAQRSANGDNLGNKRTKKETSNRNLLTWSWQATDGSSFWENKPGRGEEMVWSPSVSVWVCECVFQVWVSAQNQPEDVGLASSFSHSALQRSRVQLSYHHRASELPLFNCLTSPQHLTRSVTLRFFIESNLGA